MIKGPANTAMHCLTCLEKGMHSTEVISVDLPSLSGALIETLMVCARCHSDGRVTKVTCRTFAHLEPSSP